MINESALKAKLWIEDLLANGVPEGRMLDYKQSLPDDSPASKIDFLCDVSALANASGGNLVFGIEEERIEGKCTGIPKGYTDLKIKSVDETTRRLQELIRRGIEPSLSVQIDAIDGLPKGSVIRVNVPASWAAPHMVTLYRKDLLKPQFYKRHNMENLPMDIEEIRSAFSLAESRIERLRRFKQERISQIIGGSVLLPQVDRGAPRVVTHLLPINASDPSVAVNIKALERRDLSESLDLFSIPDAHVAALFKLRHIGFNFDGFLAEYLYPGLSVPMAYAQVFRTGAIESVRRLANEGFIDRDFEVTRIRYTQGCLRLQRELGVQLPIVITLTLWGAKDLPLVFSQAAPIRRDPIIDRDPLLLPECILEDWDTPVAEVLHPAFDALYQDVGAAGSPNYNENGQWIGGAL